MKKHIYIAACSPDGGIYHYVLDANGNAVFSDQISLPSPMYMVQGNHSLQVLLRCPEQTAPDSGYCEIPLSADGTMGTAPSNIRTTGGVVACHLCQFQDAVYAANYVSGSIARLPLVPDGLPPRLSVHSGHGVHPTRQEAPHTHFIGSVPDGSFLTAVDLGLDMIIVYDRMLSRVSSVKLPAGSGPRHLAWTADGRYAFCSCELSSETAVLSYRDGQLTYLNSISSLPPELSMEDAEKLGNTAAAVRCRGNLVSVSNRGHDSVTFYRFDGEGGLSYLCNIPAGGRSPRDFDLWGDLLICTNEKSDNVTIQKICLDQNRNLHTLCADLQQIPSPLCVLII